MSNISDVELSQLRLLQIIFETRNLTRAGERAGLTQSAVSQTLKKLRTVFNDSLVIRQGNKLILTPRAESLQPSLNRWLNDFERTVLIQEEFQPSISNRTFIISTSDQVEQIVAPVLIQHLRQVAPHVQLIFSKWDRRNYVSQLESGEVDFSICVTPSSNPCLMVTTLFRDNFMSGARLKHPYLKTKRDAQSFCNYPHILVGTGLDARGVVDNQLEKMGLSRNVQFKVANFSSAPYIVESSDGILTAPKRFMETIACRHEIAIFDTPLDLESFSMKIYWNVKNKDDAANKWMREQIIAVARQST